MIGTTPTQFRAARGGVEKKDGDGIRITAETAAALKIQVGEPVRIVELCPSDVK
jgi:arginine/ornithine N-succinyltransferase beta subunit